MPEAPLRFSPLLAASALVAAVLAISCSSPEGSDPAVTSPPSDPAKLESATQPGPRPISPEPFEVTPVRLERGRYLAEGILGCMTCHSERDWSKPGAPVIEATRGAGAVYWIDEAEGYVMPAPNLTPDPETGAGRWPDDAMARAIREGVGHDGRALNPAMYYSSFRALTDEDVRSVVVYLRSLPSLPSNAPPRKVSAERQARYEDRLLPPLIGPVVRDDLGDPLTRGRYLISVGDCMGCHTYWEGEVNPGIFAGGNRVERWGARAGEAVFSVNITPAPSGIPYYDAALFREVIRTGRLRARPLRSTMPWIAYRNLSDEDLDAVFLALQKLSPFDHWVDNNAAAATPCLRCGQEHGGGEHNRPFPATPAVELPADLLATYAGTYAFADGLTLEIVFEDGRLTGADTGDLLAESEERFRTTVWGADVSFVRDAKGTIDGMVLHELGESRGVRVRG